LNRIRMTAATALTTGALLVMPALAPADGGDRDRGPGHKPHTEHAKPHGQHPRRGEARHAVPPRIAAKLRAAERAANRAKRHSAAGHEIAALRALAAARRHLRAATKPVGSLRGDGAATALAYARAYGGVAAVGIGLLPGAPDGLVAAYGATLTAVLDARDVLVAGIASLPDRASYGAALAKISADAEREAQVIAALLSGGALTEAAKAALVAAQAQVTATAAAAKAAAGAAGAAAAA
jgi:hypothetical protein